VATKNAREFRVVFAGGGTGGHLYPAIALAEAFQKRDIKFSCVFIGTTYGIEARVVPQLGYSLHLIWMRGLLRKLTLENLLFPLRLLVSAIQCARLFGKFKPHVIIGTGGYVSGPALMAASWRKIPHVVQEQNSFPGLATRKSSKKAAAIFLTFEESRKFFPNSANVRVVGNPVRGSLQKASREGAIREWNLSAKATTLFVFGGSQGARRINQIMLEILPKLSEIKSLQILWATGPASFDEIKNQCKDYSAVRVVAYIEKMSLAYAAADFVICRSGASTLAELALCGLPSILIPFPFATADHQTFNAAAVEKAGAAILIHEKDLKADLLREKIHELMDSPRQRKKMAAAAKSLAKPRAADDIVDFCLSLPKSFDEQ
jgi:UDP-N-acetylglucosamine--N-acetylmuramyl-(pentapeptide) pyrophosphoryl-undecaprenol N-acetylglucosamine transferase